MPTIVSAQSVLTNCSLDCQIIIIVDGNADKDIQNFADFYRDRVIVLNDENVISITNNIVNSTSSYVSKMAFVKFYLAEILSNEDIVLYLDSDTVVSSDISEVFEIDISNIYAAVVEDMGVYTQFGRNSAFFCERINSSNPKYFNSGVMLLNLVKMRNDDISEKLVNYKKTGINFFVDQDAFNYLFGDNCLWLDYKYNFRTSAFYERDFNELNNYFFDGKYLSEEKCIEEQVILHLSGKYKPWKYYINGITDIFMNYYNQLPCDKIELNTQSLEKELLRELDIYRKMTIWNFPESVMKKSKKIVLYGAGKVGKAIYSVLHNREDYKIIMWVDNNFEALEDIRVKPVSSIKNIEFDYIIIGILDNEVSKAIKDNLIMSNVPDYKVITF